MSAAENFDLGQRIAFFFQETAKPMDAAATMFQGGSSTEVLRLPVPAIRVYQCVGANLVFARKVRWNASSQHSRIRAHPGEYKIRPYALEFPPLAVDGGQAEKNSMDAAAKEGSRSEEQFSSDAGGGDRCMKKGGDIVRSDIPALSGWLEFYFVAFIRE